MIQEQSLDKIKVKLEINKKTTFDWRHKILSSVSDVDKDDFTGITKSDETFFLHSSKGIKVKDCKPRKRVGSSSKIGINKEHIAVIVTQDRKINLDLTVATCGRLRKINIENTVGNKLEHHPLRADLKTIC